MISSSKTILVVAAAALCLAGCRFDPSERLAGRQFPTFALPGSAGTDSVRSKDLQGSPALVVFWATWCGPCIQEVEELRQVLSRSGSSGLKIVGLSIDETPTPVPLMVERLRIPYPVATGALPLFDSLGLESLPQSYLLDSEGKVASSFTGAVPADELLEAVARLSAKK